MTSSGVPASPVSTRTVLSSPQSRYWHMNRSPRSDSMRWMPGSISILLPSEHAVAGGATGDAPYPNHPRGLAQRSPGRGSLYSARKEGPDTMYLSRHRASEGPRWALDGRYLPRDFTLE